MGALVVYRARVWTGPGRSRFIASLFPFSAYCQCDSMCTAVVQAPPALVTLVGQASPSEEWIVDKWGRELGVL